MLQLFSIRVLHSTPKLSLLFGSLLIFMASYFIYGLLLNWGGAVLGIGAVNQNTNWKLMKPIALAWVITLPAAVALSSLTFFALINIF